MVAFFFEIILNSIPNSYNVYSLTAVNNRCTIKYFQNHYKFVYKSYIWEYRYLYEKYSNKTKSCQVQSL